MKDYKKLYEAERVENERLRKDLAMSDADFELGKIAPRDLAIKWLCRAISVSSYSWENNDLLLAGIDRLLAMYDCK